MDMLTLNNSVAVITGGGGGIGSALADYWLRNNGKVVLSDISEEVLQETRARFDVPDDRIALFPCNVTSEEDCSALADFAIEKFGQINLLAPFAGIVKDGYMLKLSKESGKVKSKMGLDQFQSVIDINLTGVFLTLRECGERMINHNCTGLICLVSSTGSYGTAGQINYSSSKAAMSVIPKVLTAAFFRQGISNRLRCVAVAPGYVATPMVKNMDPKVIAGVLEQVPIGRLIEPDEIASLVGELYRNEAMSGDVYFIHGGLRLGSKG